MMPIVFRKSSTEMPLSTWMFLKTVSAIGGCACAANRIPSTLANAMPAAAKMTTSVALGRDTNFMVWRLSFATQPLTRRFEGSILREIFYFCKALRAKQEGKSDVAPVRTLDDDRGRPLDGRDNGDWSGAGAGVPHSAAEWGWPVSCAAYWRRQAQPEWALASPQQRQLGHRSACRGAGSHH